jgi:hypothetical protein
MNGEVVAKAAPDAIVQSPGGLPRSVGALATVADTANRANMRHAS